RSRTEIWLARDAQRRGSGLVNMGYPTIDLPKENTIDKALVFALIRQESEFKPTAKSWAGARGLMQLMTFTARREAKDLKLRYSTRRLTADPAYNLRLGTHHLARLMERFEGSYPLVLAAYNAGPHRVDSWLARHGDPRKTKDIDMVDWIEMIPFKETRNYVKLVLGNYAVYRTQLGHDMEAENLVEQWAEPPDLKEARAAICRGEAPAKNGTLAARGTQSQVAERLNRVNPASGVRAVRPAHAGTAPTAKMVNVPAAATVKDATAVLVAESVCTGTN
ncbi:MAG: lytic transglycosylase domain-containing protein, partial [Pseudomonadota bacterium]